MRWVTVAGLVALGVMVTGAVLREGLVALSGGVGGAGVVGSLLAYANGVRRDKVRIRLYEIALAKATTAEEAAAILRDALGRRAKQDKKHGGRHHHARRLPPAILVHRPSSGRLWSRMGMVPREGFEPPTFGLQNLVWRFEGICQWSFDIT